MKRSCPTCHRALLSRRNKLCGFCQAPLPAELLFTPVEVEAIEATELERKRLWDVRQADRAREALKRTMNDGGGGGCAGGFGVGGF